jgi:ornithine cyclodeaminase/alanine dehydrogenase-like protein (mu-crystallin family)
MSLRPSRTPGIDGGFHVKSAARITGEPIAVVKVNGNFPNNPLKHGLPTIQGFVALLDATQGGVLAILDSGEITARRTAAATALAAQHLASASASVLSIIGCGIQARYHLESLIDVLPISEVRIFDERPKQPRAFRPHSSHGLESFVADTLHSAVRGAHIVVTLTTSQSPILRLADIPSSVFIGAIGADNPTKNELAPDVLVASRVVVDSLENATQMGDLHHVILAGHMSATNVYGSLGDIVAGKLAGRRDESECWVFDSTGLSIQDLAAAEMVYCRARDGVAFREICFGA